MSRPQHTRIFHFRSQDKNNGGTNADFTVDVRDNLRSPDGVAVKVSQVSIPYSFYHINPTTNKLDFSEDGSTETTMTMTNGNYTASEFISQFETDFNSAATATITITKNDNTGKLTISSDGGTFQLWGNSGSNASNSLAEVIGLDVSADKTGATSYAMDNHYDMLGSIYGLYIHSNIHTNSAYVSKDSSESRLLKVVPIEVPFGSIIHLKSDNESDELFIQEWDEISSIDFELQDHKGNTIDLNGLHWSITLSVRPL